MRTRLVPCSLLLAATLTACGDAPTTPAQDARPDDETAGHHDRIEGGESCPCSPAQTPGQ